MYKCEKCNLEFETFQTKANHYRWKHKDNSQYIINARKAYFRNDEIIFGKRIYENVICSKNGCNNEFLICYREGKRKKKNFCSASCANSRTFSNETNKKRSNSVKLAWKNGVYNTESYNEKQNQNRKFTSKKEREIVNYFKINYPQYQWKSGGNLKYKETGLGRDLYSDILKICFEYDGIWHFENINDQLKKKQLKDKLLEEWCTENNYRLIRIDENNFIDFKQLENLFFNENSPIIKIGKRY
jgi:hypothetical protein